MKAARVIVTIGAILVMAALFFANRKASGQARPEPSTSSAQNRFSDLPKLPAQPLAQNQPNVAYQYSTLPPHSAPQDAELTTLIQEERKAAAEASRFMKDYAAADTDDKRAKLKTKVQEALGKQFDAQQKRRDLELTRLEAQTKKLRDLMKKRTDARATIIEKRLDQLIREADGLGWASPHGPSVAPDYYPAPHYGVPGPFANPLQAK
jgi:hypothetical protein